MNLALFGRKFNRLDRFSAVIAIGYALAFVTTSPESAGEVDISIIFTKSFLNQVDPGNPFKKNYATIELKVEKIIAFCRS